MAVLIYFDNIVLDWKTICIKGREMKFQRVDDIMYSIPCSVLGTQRSVWIKISGLFEFGYQLFKLGISHFKFVLGEHDNLQSKLGNNLK